MAKKLSTFRNEDFFNFNFRQSLKSGKGVTEEVIRSTADVIVAIDGTGDFEELQEAINEVSPTGGYIQVKEGTYNLKSTINLANNIRIEGVGENTIFTTNKSIGTMFYSNNNTNITIENIKIDGNNISNITGLKLDRFSITIRNCLILNCKIGVYSTLDRGLRITNNKFETNTTSISVNGLGNDGLISDNGFFYDSGSEGIGINVGEFDFVQALLISSNVIFYRKAIKITSGELCSISNNLIESGYMLINDQNNLISSNHIADHLTINGNKNLISSNFIYGFRNITINGDDNAIYVNIVRNGSITDNGTGNTTTPNKT